MPTRWDELAAPFDRLAALTGCGDRELLARVVARCGWGARQTSEPLLPSGVRHGVPWGLSVARTRGAAPELRVFLEAQAADGGDAWPIADALLDGIADAARVRELGRGERMWHQIAFARGQPPAFHAYVCVPSQPQRALAVLARRGHVLPPLAAGARVTIVSTDLAPRGRTKLYALVPHLPPLDGDPAAAAFVRAMQPPPGARWLVCYGFAYGAAEPTSLALHFAAATHGDARLPDRVAAYTTALELPPLAHDGELHFISYQRAPSGEPRVTVYFLPQVAR